MHNMAYIIREAQRYPWAILPEKLAEIQEFFKARIGGSEISADQRAEMIKAAEEKQRPRNYGAVAVLPVLGTIAPKMNLMMAMSGGTSTEILGRQIREAAANPEVSSILLNVDSPGGSVYGLTELHEIIMEARTQKPIEASVNPFSASAGYYIPSAASSISMTPSGQAGSIGVLAMHVDWSENLKANGIKVTYIHAAKYKVEGNPYEPLSEEALAAIQEDVDDYYAMFVRDVAKGRGVSVSDVKKNFGEGRMLNATEAKAAGMVDRIESFEETVSRLSRGGSRARGARAMSAEFEFGRKN